MGNCLQQDAKGNVFPQKVVLHSPYFRPNTSAPGPLAIKKPHPLTPPLLNLEPLHNKVNHTHVDRSMEQEHLKRTSSRIYRAGSF